MRQLVSRCRDPRCGEAIKYWQVNCRCGEFLGFPNYRAAAAEHDELLTRYKAARKDAQARQVALLLAKLEALAEESRPVIAMSFAACDDILRSDKYRNYDQRNKSGEREPAGAQDHADRQMVDARLFPGYGQHIHYATLSPYGHGLPSYGPVAVCWQVTPAYLGKRASLIEENSFFFYSRHALGSRGKKIPTGRISTWDDRAKLVAAKLGAQLSTATEDRSLPHLILKAGTTRDKDDFLEIAIYADAGLDTRDVDKVTVQRAASTTEEHYRLALLREICDARRIVLMELELDAS
jgi:hypothetical protein